MEELILNLGCGSDIRPNMTNVDIRDLPGVNKIADIRELPFPDSCTKLIFLEDVLEQFTLNDAIIVLKECFRVLRLGGQLNIKVPDLISLTEKVVSDEITPFVYQEFIYGGQDYPENFHKSGYTPQFLSGICFTVGFKRVDLIERAHPNFRMLVIKSKNK